MYIYFGLSILLLLWAKYYFTKKRRIDLKLIAMPAFITDLNFVKVYLERINREKRWLSLTSIFPRTPRQVAIKL